MQSLGTFYWNDSHINIGHEPFEFQGTCTCIVTMYAHGEYNHARYQARRACIHKASKMPLVPTFDSCMKSYLLLGLDIFFSAYYIIDYS